MFSMSIRLITKYFYCTVSCQDKLKVGHFGVRSDQIMISIRHLNTSKTNLGKVKKKFCLQNGQPFCAGFIVKPSNKEAKSLVNVNYSLLKA